MQSQTDEASSVASDYSSAPSVRDLSPAVLKSIFTKGDIPSPRSNFSLCKFSSKQIFLYGGCDDKQDLNDAYILDIILMRWTKVDISLKTPLVGHSSVCLNRSLNPNRPYIYIFGGWDGSGYSDKGVLINPKTLEILTSNYNDPVIDWSNSSRGSRPHSANSESPSLIKSASLLTPGSAKRNMPATPFGAALNASRDLINNQSMALSNSTSSAKRATWFASVRSDKGKSESNFKKMIVEKVPFSRRDHTLTVDPEAQKIFLYGGWNSFHWTFDESKFLEMWTLDSNWRWTKEIFQGDVPPARRGHTTVCLTEQRTLIIYGGCSGYNAILDDCYKYDMQLIETKTSKFTKIEAQEDKFYPEGRAWHTASLIGNWIYYYGGMKPDFKATSEVISFDTVKSEWYLLKYTQVEPVRDIERYGHKVAVTSDSILIFGGSTFDQLQADELEGPYDGNTKERKISFDCVLVLETDENNMIEKAILNLKEEEEKLANDKVDSNTKENDRLKPPPIPKEFLNSQKLLEDQANFLHWNPHIFPNEANKLKIQYFKQKAEEEARKSNYNIYAEFDGLEDEEIVPPGSSKKNA